jgi:hypothetical protein
MEVITDGPREPHPMIPMRIAEFAFDPKTIDGLNKVAAEIVAVFCRKFLLFMDCYDCWLILKQVP